MVANGCRCQKNMETGTQFTWNLVDGRRTVRLPKAVFFFFKTLSLEAMKKQKLLNEEDYIFFIDSTSIKVSPDANKNKNNQEQSIRCSKWGLTTKLHPFCMSLCPVAFYLSHGNFYALPEKESWLNTYIPRIIILSWWTEPAKMIKL